jgi:hypothetical protein
MRASKARTGLRAGLACHRSWNAYGKHLPSHTQGGEPYAGKPHVRFCAGGREVTRVPTAKRHFAALHMSLAGSAAATRGARAVTHSIAQRRFILVLNQKTRPPEAAAETILIYYY